MLPVLTKRLQTEWDRLFPGINTPSSIEYLGIGGSVEGGTTTYLGFADKIGIPLFAVKIHRFPDAQNKADNETKVLSFLHSLDLDIHFKFPLILFCEKISEFWVLVQSIIAGLPLQAELAENGLPKIQNAEINLRIVLEWVLRLHIETIQDDFSSCEKLKAEQQGKIKQFMTIFDLSNAEKEILNQLSSDIDGILQCGGVVVHGDFCRHNIFYEHSQKSLGVIDWTDSNLTGLPLYDYFFFIATYFTQIRKYHGIEGFTHAFTNTFFMKNAFSKVVFNNIKTYCQNIDIDFNFAEKLFVLFLINHALFEHEKIQRCINYGELPRFNVYLSSAQELDYDHALKAQIWIHYFHCYCEKKNNFIFNIYS